MNYCLLCENFFEEYENTNDIEKSIRNYINNSYNLLNDIYFFQKRIERSKMEDIIKDSEYKNILLNTISNLKGINLIELLDDIIDELGQILDYKKINKKVYVIIGLDTTTIYSTKYQNEDVTVILLESTLGLEENIKMLFAHEYTHWIREKEIKHDIFEMCVGERFITEGIACSFSEEIVPNKQTSYYTIVPNTTVEWVENNIETIEKVVETELAKNNMMYDFFYMFAKTRIPNMPVRTGYVYGYLKVKEYMRKNNLKIKDIVKLDWREVFYG